MDSLQMNKIIGAVLGTIFIVFSIAIVSNSLFSAHAPEQFGFVIEAEEPEAGGAAEEPAAGPEPIGPLLASADASAGATVFRRCAACHTVEEGGANRVGPNLWDIVDRPVAAAEGFNYSNAMRDEAAGDNPVWTYEHLSNFLLSPRTEVPGTSMGFAGLPKADDRANVIAYLRELSNDPAPLPSPDAAAEEGTADEAADEAGAAGGDETTEPATDADSGDAPAGEASDGVTADDAGEASGDESAVPADEVGPAEDAAPVEDAAPAEDAASGEETVAPANEEAAPAEDDGAAEDAVSGESDVTPAPEAEEAPAETGNADATDEAPEAEEELLQHD